MRFRVMEIIRQNHLVRHELAYRIHTTHHGIFDGTAGNVNTVDTDVPHAFKSFQSLLQRTSVPLARAYCVQATRWQSVRSERSVGCDRLL